MRAVLCRTLGDPTKPRSEGGALAVEDVPSPTCPRDWVKVRVEAASLNFADVLMVQGSYQEKPRMPFIPGGECAGVVTECGTDVRGLKVGDRVAGVTMGGGAMAEECVIPERVCFPVPAGVSLAQAAAFPVAFGTAHLALTRYARVTPGRTVLVLGAAGGVGLAAVQVAKALGAVVVAVANGAGKMRALEDAGADHRIDASTLHSRSRPAREVESGGGDGGRENEIREDDYAGLKAAVAKVSPAGVDVLFDPVGGAGFERGLRCVKWGGVALVIGFASGVVPRLAMNVPLVKNLSVRGVYWGSHSIHAPAELAESLTEVYSMLADGRCVVRVSHALGLDDAHEGFRTIAERRAVGKVVVTPAAGKKRAWSRL